jgi:hypothetical protein
MAANPALLWPAVTVTLPGTVMLALLLDSVTTEPPEGAGAVRVTVQVEVPGAFTVAGEQLKMLGWTVMVKPMVAV